MSCLMAFHAWVGMDLVSSFIRSLDQNYALSMRDFPLMQNAPSAVAPVYLAM